MTTQIVTSPDILQTAPAAQVYVADALREADFTLVPYLRLEQLRIVCGPEIDQAQFSYVYGDIIREDSSTLTYYPPISLAGKFVKVVIPDTVYADDLSASSSTTTPNLPVAWYGRIEHDEQVAAGSNNVNTLASSGSSSSSSVVVPHARGTQFLTAFGLLRLLEQEVIDTSFIDLSATLPSISSSGPSSSAVVSQLYKVYTGLPFNSDPGGQFVRRGNRSASKIEGSYVFNWEPRGYSIWSAHNAVEYLLTRQIPVKSDGNPANQWRLDADIDYLDWYDVDVNTNGRTVKSVIDELIPRQRGLVYWVWFDSSTNKIVLSVATQTNVDITLPNGKTLKANPNQYSLDFEHALDIIDSTVTNTMLCKYHRVIARGDRRTVTFTAPIGTNPAPDVAIHPAWDAADESEYIAAASTQPDYGSLSLDQKQARNAIYRSSPRLEEVYRKFKLNQESNSNAWLCKIANGAQSFGLRCDQSVIPYTADTSFATKIYTDHIPSLRILRMLPLYEKFDYSGTNLSTFSYSAAFSANKHPAFIPPFVFAKTGTRTAASSSSSSSSGTTFTYEMLDRLHRSWKAAGDRTWSCRLGVCDTEPAIEINAHVPHFLAGIDTTGWAAMADHENHALNKGIAYTDCSVTMCVELTEHVQWEQVFAYPPTNAPEQVLILQVPGARFDYVLPYTVVDIKDGLLVQTTSGGFAKNDMLRLKSIAMAAATWYSQQRQTLDLAYRQVRGLFNLGWLITDIGQRYDRTGVYGMSSSSSSSAGLTPINTVITGITYVMGNGNAGGHTRLETGFVNLDFTDVGASR